MLIVPTYNERDNIAPLITAIHEAAPQEKILFIDDNSPDGTADHIRRLQRADPLIELVFRPERGGYGSACRAGIKKVLEAGVEDHIIQFDADLSHPPDALPRMLDLLRTYDVVIGSRYVSGGGSRNWKLPRMVLSRGANWYARTLTGTPIRDMTAGFVGYRADVLNRIDLDEISSNGYAFLMEMKFALHRCGAQFYEFPIVFVERRAGQSKFNRHIALEGARFPIKTLVNRFHR